MPHMTIAVKRLFLVEELEANIDENKRSAELLELQETLSWPTVVQLDTDAYIPEVNVKYSILCV